MNLSFKSPRVLAASLCAVLLVGTIALYWPTFSYGFVNYDDPLYLINNTHVQQGLNMPDMAWALTANYADNWHPLTWVSYMAVSQIFGNSPGPEHIVNVALHALNSVLIFLVFFKLTGYRWRSFVIAGLFAWHPLHVESVAWLAERKDVLSALFWLLTMWTYIAYVRQLKDKGRKRFLYYVATILLFALGILSKPMVVTLPFVLLLLDWWPLQRFQIGQWSQSIPCLLEKIPLFILSAISCGATLVAQKSGHVIASLSHVSWQDRLLGTVAAYFKYLGKLVWPVNLGVLYPFAIWKFGLADIEMLAALGLLTWAALRFRSSRPYWLVGWLWYLGTLVPVIGLVHVGGQAMADRYMYLPSIGLFLILCWDVAETGAAWAYSKILLGILSAGVLVACWGLSARQIQYWRNTGALMAHTIEVTQPNYLARANYASYLADHDQLDAAVAQIRKSLEIAPQYNWGEMYLGELLARQNKFDEAEAHLRKAIAELPSLESMFNLAVVYANHGKYSEAISLYRNLLKATPDGATVLNNLAWILATNPRADLRNGNEAVQDALRACQLTDNQFPVFLGTLAAAYAETGQFDKAVETARKASAIAAQEGDKRLASQNAQLEKLYESHRAYHEGRQN